MMEVLNWILDNLGGFSTITTLVLFVAYFRLNKRQKKAEVKQSEGSALVTMEQGYSSFAEHSLAKVNEVMAELKCVRDELEKEREDRKREKEVNDYKHDETKRVQKGMQETLNREIKRRRRAENLICFVRDCKLRKPPLGTYKEESA